MYIYVYIYIYIYIHIYTYVVFSEPVLALACDVAGVAYQCVVCLGSLSSWVPYILA